MSKMKLIRCKTPHDIIVVRKRVDFNMMVEGLSSNGPAKCGHPHLIICGDVYFSIPKEKK